MTIRNIQHFSMSVPDLAIARVFYEDFGLETFERDGTLVCRCYGRDQDQVILTQGPRKRLTYVSYGTDEQSLREIRANLERGGVELLDAPKNVPGEGLWFRDFDGMLTNVKAADEAPWDTAPRVTFNTLDNRTARKGRTELIDEKPIRPRRMGHVVLFSTDPNRKVAFYNEMFNLRLSDSVASFLNFLHSPHGSDHHIVAFGKSSTYGLHHVGFDVGTTDEVGAAARQMVNKGYIPGWGPGRHFVGSNTFAYIRDPWNSMHEYFADMDFIAPGVEWEAQDWQEVGTRSIWGESEPLDFPTNFETPELR
ncbi:Metapyrocatechase [Paraburkholderia unamae]|uniref:VOC family protein n=1 Tax=Paraburkholderia unamae TaxID=219649 RepID=UPI000DC57E9A|nr:VOC family protein [Paraburkholderia unamae]RAR66104.1 catechol-2,3-dioxygenase [Paraburkholderia unamae]CAG9271637.1 Metapyrocatechase [Paraburkholderia unamae]